MAIIQLRRAETVEWDLYDPILMEGEIGVDLTTRQLKVGNGADQWSELPYLGGSGGGGGDLSEYLTIGDASTTYATKTELGALDIPATADDVLAIPQGDITRIVVMTQAAYDALTPKVATTLYVIVG